MAAVSISDQEFADAIRDLYGDYIKELSQERVFINEVTYQLLDGKNVTLV